MNIAGVKAISDARGHAIVITVYCATSLIDPSVAAIKRSWASVAVVTMATVLAR